MLNMNLLDCNKLEINYLTSLLSFLTNLRFEGFRNDISFKGHEDKGIEKQQGEGGGVIKLEK